MDQVNKSVFSIFDRHFLEERHAMWNMVWTLLIVALLIVLGNAYIIGGLLDDVASLKAAVKELSRTEK